MIKHTAKDYVCPKCFNRINKCICNYSTDNLIMIDYKIQNAIKILNQKKYYTTACCEGHYRGKNIDTSIYITFKNIPLTIPYNWHKSRNGFYYYIKPKNKKQFKEEQKTGLENLYTWISTLE